MEASLINLPAALIISKMTYYPFEEVRALCAVNQRMREICTDPRYARDWEALIRHTYGEYADKITSRLQDGQPVYNYLTYVQLIDKLPPNVQIEIYRKQGDWDNYHRVIGTLPYRVQLELYRKYEDWNDFHRIGLLITFPEIDISNVTDYTGLWKHLDTNRTESVFPSYSPHRIIIPPQYMKEIIANFKPKQSFRYKGISSVIGQFGEIYKIASRMDLSTLDPNQEYEGVATLTPGVQALDLYEVLSVPNNE